MSISEGPAAVREASPSEAFEALKTDPRARLVDVRTRAEWTFVGVPMPHGADPILLEWQSYPSMAVAPDFAQTLQDAARDKDAPLYFICRSGGRSLAAAKATAAAGYTHCFNVTDGFEGPPDDEGHRGRRAGWKADGLPWRQT